MLNIKEFRVGNLLQGTKGVCVVSYINNEKEASFKVRAWRSDGSPYGNEDDNLKKLILTKEWFKHFNFEIADLGEFWEFRKGDFILIQMKSRVVSENELPPIFILHSVTGKKIKVPFVHKLQNLYYEIMGEELI